MPNAAMAPRRCALWRAAFASGILLAWRDLSGVVAQDDDSSTCADVSVSGLSEDDGFPASTAVYTNSLGDEERGEYINSEKTHFIWYSAVDPIEHTTDTPEAEYGDCTGLWVISTYPLADTFDDDVWYESSRVIGPVCATSPAQLTSSDWARAERSTSSSSVATREEAVLAVTCNTEEDDSSDGISDKTVIVLLIVIGVGFMVLMCLGALACCIKGQNHHEQAIMPPGELTEGSVIGGKADEDLKPGLHAHPEVQGAQHPRPEDWAPSYTSSRSAIPTGSRSGPSVRSIGYT